MTQIYHILSKITTEPPALPPVEHAGAHILNAPLFQRKYARVYLGDPESREAIALRKQVAKGARVALEEQYWDVLERTLQARPMDARLGGDPSVVNRVRAFLLIRHYKNGEWGERIEVGYIISPWIIRLTPMAFHHCSACRRPANLGQVVLPYSHRSFPRGDRRGYPLSASHRPPRTKLPCELQDLVGVTRSEVSPSNPPHTLPIVIQLSRLPKLHRDHLQSTYNGHMLHSSTTDPFKLALYKLMGKIDPSKRTVPDVTVTTEDWLWFQLAMVRVFPGVFSMSII